MSEALNDGQRHADNAAACYIAQECGRNEDFNPKMSSVSRFELAGLSEWKIRDVQRSVPRSSKQFQHPRHPEGNHEIVWNHPWHNRAYTRSR